MAAKRRRRVLHCLQGLVLFVVVGGLVGFFLLDRRMQRSSEGQQVFCHDEDSLEFISNLCHNYSKGLVTGSMCWPLCVTKELTFKKCLGHKITDFVMLASLTRREEERERRKTQEDLVIMKADATIQLSLRLHFDFSSSQKYKQSDKDKQQQTDDQQTIIDYQLSLPYHQNVTQLRHFIERIHNISRETSNRILSECDQGLDGVLTNREAAYCWHMIDKDEILLGLLFESHDIAPRVFGVCGNLFVMEYVPTLPVTMPLMNDIRSWDFRARLAIGFIELVERIDNLVPSSGGENLLLCDAQESNFGVLKIDDSYTVMSIDNDLSIFERSLAKSLKFELNNTCSSNDDCSFINCDVHCDNKRGKCSGEILSNNLQLVCQRFFIARHQLFLFPLLHDPPLSIQRNLKTLLHECIHPLEPSTRISKRLAKNLKKLLLSTLKKDWTVL